MIWEILEREWVAGLLFCKVFKFFQTYALASSNYMLVALAMDRHRAVTKPLKVSGSQNRLVEYPGFLNSILLKVGFSCLGDIFAAIPALSIHL